jgi:hypothetical protein
MTCIFKRFHRQGDSVITLAYTCDEVRLLAKYWKAEFRRINKSDYLGRPDRLYEAYAQEINDFLSHCTCRLIPSDRRNVNDAQELNSLEQKRYSQDEMDSNDTI